MKILVKDGDQISMGAMRVKINDLGGELEKVSVRIIKLSAVTIAHKTHGAEEAFRKKQLIWRHFFRKMLASNFAAQAQAPVKPKSIKMSATKTLEIKISFPSLPHIPIPTRAETKEMIVWAGKKLARTSAKTRIATAVGVVALVIAGYYGFRNSSSAVLSPNIAVSKSNSLTPPKLIRGTPSYATILPANKTIQQLGGWTRISPPNATPVYAYIDKINNTQINVSEQPLPNNLRSDSASQIAQLAQNFSASDKFTVAGTTVYIGTSTNNQQSVIFSEDSLLILIKSTSEFTNDQWVTYINSLH